MQPGETKSATEARATQLAGNRTSPRVGNGITLRCGRTVSWSYKPKRRLQGPGLKLATTGVRKKLFSSPKKRLHKPRPSTHPTSRVLNNSSRAVSASRSHAENPNDTVLVYPAGKPGAVTLYRKDVHRLAPEKWLNDSLVELGLKIWLSDLSARDPRLADDLHVFNSFFYKKLDNGLGEGCNHESVKKWTRGVDLFKKKYIIVPINERFHWYLAIICFPSHVLRAPPVKAQQRAKKARSRSSKTSTGAKVQPYSNGDDGVIQIDTTDEELDDEQTASAYAQKCWILIFDSLAGRHDNTVRVLREYLQAEAQERHGKLVETKNAQLSRGLIEDRHLTVPRQPNGWDCGIYLLHHVETFIENPLELLALSVCQPMRKNASRRTALWKEEQVLKKRAHFQDTVNILSAEWQKAKLKGV
ncbi:hypothetical protein FRC08_000797 [Ceratobasidium sp. 394]|nr:hypothetical protein FRC08_000797 [Ceratobasidium sp. 394]KAG9086422.1 hypothetical protein FS749_003659 [Ceratobasidium sp. UAMH 11750]